MATTRLSVQIAPCLVLLLAAALHAQDPPPVPSIPGDPSGITDTSRPLAAVSRPASSNDPISGNPAATNSSPGTGTLGQLLRLDQIGIRLGGIWIYDQTGDLLGGLKPGDWSGQNLLVLDLTADLEQLCGWKGGKAGIEFLNHRGSTAGELTGDVQGFNGLDGGPPLSRSQLYQLWYLQTFFDKHLSVRIGKQVPSYDFANIADVTGLIMTPVFTMPTILGREPGYPDSATGIAVIASPGEHVYAQFGFYDGRLGGSGTPTGVLGPQFNGQYFYIGETGLIYTLGRHHLNGRLGVGAWGQSGKLPRFDGGTQDGTTGFYLFVKQHLWYENPGVDRQGIAGYFQLGLADPEVQLVQQYLGCGIAWTGFLPRRDRDSIGMGVAWSRLTSEPGAEKAVFPQFTTGDLRSNETILQWYYQSIVSANVFLQPTLTYIIDPGSNSGIKNPLAVTLRLGIQF